MYASTLLTHDIFNKNVQKFEYDYNANYKSRNSVNMNKGGHGPLVALTNVKGNTPINKQYSSKTFLHPTASTNLHSTGTYNNSDKWLQETVSRFVERVENFKLKIETYGNTDLMVGDIIEVIIPANRPLSLEASIDVKDRVLSGRYVITELHNLVQPGNKIHTMTMTVMKDSFENSPAHANTKYKELSDGGVGGLDRDFI